MRKSNREIKDFETVLAVFDSCQTIRLALHDEPFPYVVPLSFGWECVDGKLNLYFHCAKEGKKVNLIARNNAVAVEADLLNGYVRTERGVTADYKSVIAFGTARPVCGEEAVHGIELLLKHCGVEGYSASECVVLGVVAVYKISVESVTGKSRF